MALRVFSSLQGAVDKEKREVGRLAVWSVTSAKPGNGVELLRDGREDTYWQSDGTQPHLVNVQFQKKVFLSHVAIFSDFKLDESYTPSKISVRVGTSLSDLHEVKVVDLAEPQGWAVVPLAPPDQPDACVKAYILQLAVISNHQNGRDTHMRQVRVYGPRQDPLKALFPPLGFSTPEFSMFGTCR